MKKDTSFKLNADLKEKMAISDITPWGIGP